jgi:transglutaminase-like putative cysteine protease
MRTVRKFTLTVLILLTAYGFLGAFAYTDVVQVEGEMGSTATAYVKRWFSSYRGTKNLTYRMFFPQSSTEGINTQNISNLRKSFTPFPNDVKEFTDGYGNSGVELIWNKEIRIVQLDLQFSMNTYTNYAPVTSTVPLPFPVDDALQVYQASTSLSPSNEFYINYIGRALTNGLQREIDAVYSIFLWVDRNIRLLNSAEDEYPVDALSVLKQRAGDEKGISNLVSSLLKGIGIPARVVYGISFQKDIIVNTGDKNLVFDLPNSERFWVEVFFPDIGWVGYDPHGMYFGILPHTVKLSVGPDSDFVVEKWGVEGEAEIQKEFIYDIQSDYNSALFNGYGFRDVDKIILCPVLTDIVTYGREPNLEIEGLMLDETHRAANVDIPETVMSNSEITRSLVLDATLERVYAQRIDLNVPVTLTELRLPLLKFGDEGRIWGEVYTDSNGIPGDLLFKTFSIDSTRIRYMLIDNPWISFPVGKKTNTLLTPGRYWFMLRSSGSCIFNWYATEGNIFGQKIDTVYRKVGEKRWNWNNVPNYDMNFQLIGKYQ